MGDYHKRDTLPRLNMETSVLFTSYKNDNEEISCSLELQTCMPVSWGFFLSSRAT